MTNKQRDDEKLWEKVKRTVKPIKSNRTNKLPDPVFETDKFDASQEHQAVPKRIVRPFRPEPLIKISQAPKPTLLDEPTRRKISKGRMDIDARLDLHGLTQLQAYEKLSQFLEQAQLMGNRTILVITGKGTRGEGVLRKAVPLWLSEPSFSRFVSGYHEASLPHGGSGALYVRIRRRKAG